MGDLRLCPRRPNGILRDDRLFMLSSTSSSSSSTSSSSSPPQPLSNPDPLSIGAECWAKAEQTTQEIVSRIHPTLLADQKRWAVIDYVRRLIKRSLGCEVFPYGSVPLKTYLPDGDIDLTTLRSPKVDVSLASDVHAVLEREQQNEAAEYEVKEVQFIDAEVKLVKCIVQNIVVDISFNQLGGLCTLCFLEQVNCLIAKDHIFKRSIILIKAWCFYESRILGAHHGLISTYALETLILYIFHLFHSSLDGPLAVLYRFLDYFSNFDWENYCISLKGPVSISSLPNTEAELLENGVDGLLLGEEFLNNCVAMFSVGRDSRAFPQKYLNIIDPLKENNNLGRSVHRGNSYRIRSAFKYGACKLGRILSLPTERMEDEIKKFFTNTLERHGSNYRFDVKNSVLCSGAKGSGSSSSTLSSMKMLSEGNQKLCTDFSCGNISRVTDGNTVRIRNRPVICLTKAATFPVSETDFPVYGNAVSEYRYSGDANELATTGFRHLKVTNDAPICSSSSSNLGSCFGNSHFSPHSKLAGLVTENEHLRQNMPANSLIDKDTGSISQLESKNCLCSNHGCVTSNSWPISNIDSPLNLSGDYDRHINSLLCGQAYLGYPLSTPVLPSPSYHLRSQNRWEAKQNNTNGTGSRLPSHPLNPSSLAISSEGTQKPRGTGTYIPNMNWRPNMERPFPGRIRYQGEARGHLHRQPHNDRLTMALSGTNFSEERSQEAWHIQYPTLSRSKSNPLDYHPNHPPIWVPSQTHPLMWVPRANGSSCAERFESRSLGHMPIREPAPEESNHHHSGTPAWGSPPSPVAHPVQSPASVTESVPVAVDNIERVAEEVNYLKEEDFPPLSLPFKYAWKG